MLHLLLDKDPWFERRGSCWHIVPVRWQAHLLIAMFLLALIGVQTLSARGALTLGQMVVAIATFTVMFMVMAWKRTAAPITPEQRPKRRR